MITPSYVRGPDAPLIEKTIGVEESLATPEEIREFCNVKIAHFKIPQLIRFVDSFPTTVSGKIQKFRIREMELQKEPA